jgi:hypothetical protein
LNLNFAFKRLRISKLISMIKIGIKIDRSIMVKSVKTSKPVDNTGLSAGITDKPVSKPVIFLKKIDSLTDLSKTNDTDLDRFL